MVLLSYLLGATLVGHVLAARMSDRFAVAPNCGVHDVDAMLEETLDMTQNAMASIDTILQATSFNWATASSDLRAMLWAAQAAWGIKQPSFSTFFRISSSDRAQLTSVREKYEGLQSALQNGNGLPLPKYYFWCDSDTLKWTTRVGDIFGSPQYASAANQLIKDVFSRGTTIANGLWKDPDHETNGDFNFVPDEYAGKSICGPHAAEAITYQSTGNMFLCPKAWDTANYKTSIKSLRGTTGNLYYKDFRSVPGTFLHEMMHLINFQPHITDETVQGLKAYGMIRCYTLADGAPSRALTNADSYNVFAVMTYLTKGTWLGDEP